MRALALAALLLLACGEAEAPAGTGTMPAAALVERLASGDVPIVLDVRTPEEFAKGHIPGAINIPHDQLEERLAEVEDYREGELVVHCQSGRRAAFAEEVLRDAGFENVLDLEGHWQAWQAAGHPSQ